MKILPCEETLARVQDESVGVGGVGVRTHF